MKYVLIVGAKSDIALELAREYARNGYGIYLAARESSLLQAFSIELETTHNVKVHCLDFDILNIDSHKAFYEKLEVRPEGVLLVVGYNGDQDKAKSDFRETQKIISTNFTGCVSLLQYVALAFEQRGHGFIVAISSAAGDRGKPRNYIYGAAKAGLTTYLSGLRGRLFESGVTVLTVKPGFINTRAVAEMNLPKLLTGSPRALALKVFKAQKRGRGVLYFDWYWKWIMMVIRLIPERFFKRLKL